MTSSIKKLDQFGSAWDRNVSKQLISTMSNTDINASAIERPIRIKYGIKIKKCCINDRK